MKLSIDLLPLEFKEEELKNTKFYKIQLIGIMIILVMFFLSSLTVSLRILQNQNMQRLQNNLSVTEQRITDLKSTQAAIFILKDRLATINQYLDSPSEPNKVYRIVSKLLPPSATINTFSVDRNAQVSLTITITDNNVIDTVLENLMNKEKNEGKIETVTVESINRGRDGVYRLALRIKTK